MTTITEFQELWDAYGKVKRAIDEILRPALEAIKEFHLKGYSGCWVNDYALTVDGRTGKPEMQITIEYMYNVTEEERDTYSILLEDCLAGKAAVIASFMKQRDIEIQQSIGMGKRRNDQEKEIRRKKFLDLKLEFEPPEGAIIKKDL